MKRKRKVRGRGGKEERRKGRKTENIDEEDR